MYTLPQTAEFIIKSICPEPQAVQIRFEENNDTTLIEITAPSELTGQIVGRHGRIIKAVRHILNLTFPDQKYLLEVKN